MAGPDSELARRAAGERRSIVVERDWAIERLMVAADVALTKMSRSTTLELRHLGIPQVGLSWRLNPIDDRVARAIGGVACLDARQVTPEDLADAIHAISAAEPPRGEAHPNGAMRAADRRVPYS